MVLGVGEPLLTIPPQTQPRISWSAQSSQTEFPMFITPNWGSTNPQVTGVEFSTLDFESLNNGNAPNITAVAGYNVTANASTVSQGYQFNLTGPISITKFVGVASTDAFADPKGEAMNSSVTAVQTGWEALVSEHIQAWEDLWDSADIVVPNNQEVQLTARSALFHLWSNVRSGYEQPGIGDTSIAPAGLTSDSYAGQVNRLFESSLILDLLGRRYFHVSRASRSYSRFRSLHRQLPSKKSGPSLGKCKAV
jgi:hypothetical protein